MLCKVVRAGARFVSELLLLIVRGFEEGEFVRERVDASGIAIDVGGVTKCDFGTVTVEACLREAEELIEWKLWLVFFSVFVGK